jgi:acyl-CoA synthetase (AMP-forming)/AMP-acid ligase II
MPTEPSASLLSIPLFHATGCLSILVAAIKSGNKLVFQRRWSVADAVKLIVAENVQSIGGVPAIATAILQSPLLPTDHQFTSVGYGGAPPAKRLAGDLKKRFPAAMLGHGWGMTETNAPHCSVLGQDYVERPTSIGPVLPICQIKIVDPETRKELPQGQAGIILARGPNIMKGYLNNPEATAEVLVDGWMDTGDVGMIDPDGFVHLSDRHKDIIIRGGENIASLEVENAVAQDDRVAEVAAVSVPDKILGELVGVAVSLAPGATATEASILEKVTPHLRYPARPVIALVLDEPLPRNANGKIVKADVRKLVRAAYAEKKAEPKAKL